MSDSRSHHRSTERVTEIFEYLTDTENVGKTLTEISAKLAAPKSSILPILRTLTDNGYLHYNALTLRYFIGYKLYEIGTKYVSEDNIGDAIYRVMQEIVTACEVTVSLGELVAGDILYLQKIDLFEKLRLYKAVGRRLPAYSTALGKVLLSEKSRDEIIALYPDGLSPLTPKTITDIDILCEQLESVRQVGFAFADEEATKYVRSIAVPIRKNDVIIYGMDASLSALNYSEEKERRIIYSLHEAKTKIENFLRA